MQVRDGVIIGIELLARHYPSFAPKDDQQLRMMVGDYEQALCFTDGDTIAAGFRVVLDGAGKYPPRYPEIVAAVRDTHRRRNFHAQPVSAHDDRAICRVCGTESLQEIPHPSDATAPTRLYPLHRDGCLLALPEYARRACRV